MATSERKRPWYLVLALFASLLFGVVGARSGWVRVTWYRDPVDSSLAGQGIEDDADRAAVVTRLEDYFRTLDAAKDRAWPLGIATLLLGGATLLFSLRAMGGSGVARTAVVQLVLAQAAVGTASHYLLRDVEQAELPYLEAIEAAKLHETTPDRSKADEASRVWGEALRAAAPIALAFQLVGSALIVVALTRRRARDFFDGVAATVGER
ncbi:MAG: hypothetical protein JOZ69_16620 [Myxococcales bacterium]|nr:hypothetical protein [Myxococcales bacterium]